MGSSPDTPSAWASALYHRCLGEAGAARKGARGLRRLLLACGFGQVPVKADYFGRPLVFPFHHDLLIHARTYPQYDRPLRRLALALRRRDGRLTLVDIGANIGEILPLVDSGAADRLCLIEGSASYLPYLRTNVRGAPGVRTVETYLSDTDKTVAGAERTEHANARVDTTLEGSVRFVTLDSLEVDAWLGGPLALLKVDIEGYEPRALQGGRNLIARHGPVVYIEWHPRLLKEEGQPAGATLDWLRGLGYTEALVYGNHGGFFKRLPLAASSDWDLLESRALGTDHAFYDLAVFRPEHAAFLEPFASAESSVGP